MPHHAHLSSRHRTPRGLLTGVVSLSLALTLAGLGPASAAPKLNDASASAEVAAQIDTGELEAAVASFVPGDAASAADLANVVAPDTALALDGVDDVQVATDGSLVLQHADTETELGVGIADLDADDSAEVIDDAAVNTGVATDLDVVTRASDAGAQILTVLGSADAPNTLRFDLDLPAGASLTENSDGSVLVSAPVESQIAVPTEEARIEAEAMEIIVHELTALDDIDSLTETQLEQLAEIQGPETRAVTEVRAIAEIEAPWAVDAHGDPVATHFELDGNNLVQIVETNVNTAFPVLADPSFVWWVKMGAGCLASVTTLATLGYLRFAAGIAKMTKTMRAASPNSKLGKAYKAWKKLGSSDSARFKAMIAPLKSPAKVIMKHGYSGIAKHKKKGAKAAAVVSLFVNGSSTLAAAFGLSTCIAMVTA